MKRLIKLLEKIGRKKVFKKGKLVWKFYTTKKDQGYRITVKGGRPKEVMVSPAEQKRKAKSARRGARKAKHKQAISNIKRLRTLMKKAKMQIKKSPSDMIKDPVQQIPTED